MKSLIRCSAQQFGTCSDEENLGLFTASCGGGNASCWATVAIVLLYAIPIATAQNGLCQGVASIAELTILLLTVRRDEFIYAFPIVLFFYTKLVVFNFISIYRIYTIIYIIRSIILQTHYQKRSCMRRLIPYCVIVLYILFVISIRSPQLGVNCFIDFTFLFLFTSEIERRTHQGALVDCLVLAGVSSGIYGILSGASMDVGQSLDGAYYDVTRYLCSFEDVNYAGFFLNVALICALSAESDTLKRAKPLIVVFLYYSIIRTGSTTAYICNVVAVIAFICLRYRTRGVKAILLITSMLILLITLYNLSLNYLDNDFLNTIALRVNDKLNSLQEGDIDRFTTLRTALSREHINYFISLESLPALLFGGHAVAAPLLDTQIFSGMAHNEYIDLLLNVGLFGAVLLGGACVLYTCKFFVGAVSGDSLARTSFLIKILLIMYAGTITIFLDSRFYFFFFI